jgi:hypothetical protein
MLRVARRPIGYYGPVVALCAQCGQEVEREFRFCPWCAAPRRRKLVEFFRPHPRDSGKALRVSRYLDDEPHVRFSVWSESGVAQAAVSLDEDEAQRLALFLLDARRRATPPASALAAALRAAGRRRPRRPTRTP